MERQIHAWQEEELEEEAGLLGRQFRQRNNNSEANVVEEAEETLENEAEEAEKTQENGAELTEDNGRSKSVYFETHQGIWKCRHCYWTYRPPSLVLRGGSAHGVSGMEYSANESSASETNKDSDLRKNKFEIQTSPSTETDCENGKTLASETLSGLSLVTAQKLHDHNIKNLEELHNSAEGDAGDVLADEIDNEFTDLDVERVLQKQNTHDLYCPNCNSCITRRVILLRRRKRVRNIRYTQKPRNQSETRELDFSLPYKASGKGPQKLDDSQNGTPMHSAIYQNNGGQLNVSPNGTPVPPAVDPNNDGQLNVSPDGAPAPPDTEIFRCLSCLSLFIPSGNGCKLIQCFGGSNDNVNTQDVQNRPEPMENWWSKIFSSVNKKTSIDHGNATVDVEPQPVDPQPVQTHPVQTKPLETHAVETHAVETHAVVTHVVETKPLQTQPVETHAVETRAVVTDAVETKPLQPQPVQAHAFETHAVVTDAVETKPLQMQPVQTHAVETKPLQTQPVQKYWLFGIFSSDKKKASIDHGDDVIIDVESQPVEPQPLQTHQLQPHPVPTFTVPTQPVEPPVESQPVEPQPLQTHQLQPHPVPTFTVPTQPLHTQPLQTPQTQPLQAQQTLPLHSQPVIPVEARNWDILKSTVYGGLVESITSFGVVSSAAGAGATTLNILALGLASVVGGLFIIADNIKELKNDHSQINEQEDRYQRLLGRRQNFARHAIVVVISFLIFGLLPPVIYGFSFWKSDDRYLKIAAVAGSSIACIVFLATAKAHVQNRSYWKTVLYYVSLGVVASGLSYVVGNLFDKLMEKLGLFKSSTEVMIPFLETDLMNTNMMKPAWSAY